MRLIFLIVLLGTLRVEAKVERDSVVVYAFLSTICPMCIAYTPVLNQIAAEFGAKQVKVVGVFPNFYTSDSLVNLYRKEQPIDFEVIIDRDLALTNKFGATLTPEVFVVSNNQVLYQGLIDDSYFRPGKRRGKTSKHYLKTALNAIIHNQKPSLSYTQSIGCAIVKN